MRLQIKYISQDMIRSKWTTLDEDAQTRIEEILRSVELPVLARYTSEQKKIDAQDTVTSLTQTSVGLIP